MRKMNCEADITSPWRRCQEAKTYFGIGRNTLDKHYLIIDVSKNYIVIKNI